MSDTPVPSIPEDWLEAIARHIQVDAKSKDHATDEMLRVQNDKIQENAMLPLIHYLQRGDKQQQHDAAKALGYIAKTGAFTAKQRDDVKVYLLDIVKNATLSPGVAFAVLEALERVDPDAFWSLLMRWYESYTAARDKAKIDELLQNKGVPATSVKPTETAKEPETERSATTVSMNSTFKNLDSRKKEGL